MPCLVAFGVGTKIDPTLTRTDRLVGQVLGLKDNLPNVFTESRWATTCFAVYSVSRPEGAKRLKSQAG